MSDENASCTNVDDKECPGTPQPSDDVTRCEASSAAQVENEGQAACDDDDDDDAASDSDTAVAGDLFPVKPPQHAAAASCPPSPSSDIVRTSAEGETCEGPQEQTNGPESDDTSSTTTTRQ